MQRPGMRKFLVQRGFLIALVGVLAAGMVWAPALQTVSEWSWLRDGVVAAVMLCMALPLQAQAMWQALRQPLPTLLAIAVTYGILPVASWLAAGWLPGDLGGGLLVVAATPCTLASAAVWTRRAGGNDAVATLVTLLTNSTCFLVTPLWLSVLIGTRADPAELSLARMAMQLGLLVVIPILVAQLARRHPPVVAWTHAHLAALGHVTQGGILFMVLLGAIRTGLRLRESTATIAPAELAVMVVIVLGLHLAMFWAGMGLGRLAGCSRADQIAIGFAGSQKTLTVGLLMAMTLGVSILPMVAYHCLQLVVDTFLADALRPQPPDA